MAARAAMSSSASARCGCALADVANSIPACSASLWSFSGARVYHPTWAKILCHLDVTKPVAASLRELWRPDHSAGNSQPKSRPISQRFLFVSIREVDWSFAEAWSCAFTFRSFCFWQAESPLDKADQVPVRTGGSTGKIRAVCGFPLSCRSRQPMFRDCREHGRTNFPRVPGTTSPPSRPRP